jgi:hypothetical protein
MMEQKGLLAMEKIQIIGILFPDRLLQLLQRSAVVSPFCHGVTS